MFCLKHTFFICLLLYFPVLHLSAQPVSWFTGAGGGITRLSPYSYAGKKLTHGGNMVIGMAGVDIPLHQNLRPVVRATLCFFNARFHSSQIPSYMTNYRESYNIQLSSLTTDLSFLYHVVNKRIKLYAGAGFNIHQSWSNQNIYELVNTRTGYVFNRIDNLIFAHEWLSYNVKIGIRYKQWELGAAGFVRGIISEMNFEILNADLYFIWLGFHFNNQKK